MIIVDSATGEPVTVSTHEAYTGSFHGLGFSPDGSHVAFVEYDESRHLPCDSRRCRHRRVRRRDSPEASPQHGARLVVRRQSHGACWRNQPETHRPGDRSRGGADRSTTTDFRRIPRTGSGGHSHPADVRRSRADNRRYLGGYDRHRRTRCDRRSRHGVRPRRSRSGLCGPWGRDRARRDRRGRDSRRERAGRPLGRSRTRCAACLGFGRPAARRSR